MKLLYKLAFLLTTIVILFCSGELPAQRTEHKQLLSGRYLFVAVPGIRDYMGYGGHGLLVFDMDHGHRFIKRRGHIKRPGQIGEGDHFRLGRRS